MNVIIAGIVATVPVPVHLENLHANTVRHHEVQIVVATTPLAVGWRLWNRQSIAIIALPYYPNCVWGRSGGSVIPTAKDWIIAGTLTLLGWGLFTLAGLWALELVPILTPLGVAIALVGSAGVGAYGGRTLLSYLVIRFNDVHIPTWLGLVILLTVIIIPLGFAVVYQRD